MPQFVKVLLEEARSAKELSVLGLAFRRLWNKGSKTGVVLAVVFSALEAVLYTINPALLRHLIDILNKGYNFGWQQPLPQAVPFLYFTNCQSAAVWLTVVMSGFSVLWYGAFNLSTGFARNATYHSQVTFGTEAFAHIVNQSMDFHVQSKKGEVLAKTDQTIQQAQDFLYNSFFSNFLRAALSTILIFLAIFSINWQLGVICLVALGFGYCTNIPFGVRVSRAEKEAWKNVSEVQARALDVLNNISEIKIFGNEDFEVRRRQQHAEQQLPHLRKSTLLWRWLTSIENIWQNAGFAAAMFLIVLPNIFARKMTVGQVAQFISYYLMLFGYFMDLLFKYLNAQRLIPRLKDLDELLKLKPSVVNISPRPFKGLNGEFEFRNLLFAYSEKGRLNTVLNEVNLIISKGQSTVLAGKTGCGKSTLVNLLMRLYDPTVGVVLADGVNIKAYELNSYHRSFAVLSQQAYLFNASIAYNIAYSRIGANMEDIVKAAKIAQAHEFISRLPHGYDTVVSERAANFSGGQKQRIALARAVLARDAEVVVLDEPTTGLDPKTAAEFLDELMNVFSGKTIIVITHDPSVMRRADQIVYLEEGRVSQVGTHEQLISSSHGYRSLVQVA